MPDSQIDAQPTNFGRASLSCFDVDHCVGQEGVGLKRGNEDPMPLETREHTWLRSPHDGHTVPLLSGGSDRASGCV